MFFSTTGCVVHHENTQRWTVGCYNGLQVSCFGDFEKLFCISIYCVSALSLHIESTDSMIYSYQAVCLMMYMSIHCEYLDPDSLFVMLLKFMNELLMLNPIMTVWRHYRFCDIGDRERLIKGSCVYIYNNLWWVADDLLITAIYCACDNLQYHQEWAGIVFSSYSYSMWINLCMYFCLYAVYTVEILLRIIGVGIISYFKSAWNV